MGKRIEFKGERLLVRGADDGWLREPRRQEAGTRGRARSRRARHADSRQEAGGRKPASSMRLYEVRGARLEDVASSAGVERVTIRWPSGATRVIEAPDLDVTLEVAHPEK